MPFHIKWSFNQILPQNGFPITFYFMPRPGSFNWKGSYWWMFFIIKTLLILWFPLIHNEFERNLQCHSISIVPPIEEVHHLHPIQGCWWYQYFLWFTLIIEKDNIMSLQINFPPISHSKHAQSVCIAQYVQSVHIFFSFPV
jgi:hypothetical protein